MFSGQEILTIAIVIGIIALVFFGADAFKKWTKAIKEVKNETQNALKDEKK